MYVDTLINGKPLQALLDTRADAVYVAKQLADEVGLSYTKEEGYVKGVNARSVPIHGVTQGTPIQISQWKGKVNITIAPLDDKKFILGIDLPNAMKAHLVPYIDTLCIMETGQPCNVPAKRGIDEGNILCALQFSKELKKKEPTFRATLKMEEEPKEFRVPKAI